MIRHIVALDARRGIAKDGAMPGWKLPADEAYFMEQTKRYGGNVLMGRKTFEEALHGRPLKDRHNYVATRHDLAEGGIDVVTETEAFITHWPSAADLWVIGGAEVYAQTLDAAEELYITEIESDFGCDRFYPEYLADFVLASRSEPVTEHGITYTFCIYIKR